MTFIVLTEKEGRLLRTALQLVMLNTLVQQGTVTLMAEKAEGLPMS